MKRECGACQACCKLLPITSLRKPSGQRCSHQKFGKGCNVHGTVEQPLECRVWSCGWLLGAPELRRPDYAHYVADPSPDFVVIGDPATGFKLPVFQIWVDPKFPDAHRDPPLREFVDRIAREKGMGAVIRYSETEAFLLVAPSLSESGKWEEMRSTMAPVQHTLDEIAAAHIAHAASREGDAA